MPFRYAVEIRSPTLFRPPYFRALREHGIAHVFSSWTDMPSIASEMAMAEAFTANFIASGALMIPGRAHQTCQAMFAPYGELREPNLEVRNALRDLLIRGKKRAEPVFVFVNNRLEGFAPGTIAAIVDSL